ncbi:hybrid sensor histidine kinase/response regulator [Leptothoe kymatousa]|uniref:histidine kinase n=1 Tax=Leptothoe kymatousa TAU-MAC 1615 TaxID=2364775 RepID=A0ABS5XYA2_9CYAN|nr:response regulator [Leptothoe kymatousa]MBT9310632.1 response regulator [Leptothoe kymatousa TAU-MAC 1615]
MYLGTVLVVDDNPHNLGVISECLDTANLEVLIAKSGESALEKVAYATPDVILLDVMMPGISGFETCQQLKANPDTAHIPIIFMTALTDTESKVKAFQLGAADYVTKPFQEAEIIARIKTHLKLHQALQNIQNTNKKLEEKIHQQELTEKKLRTALIELKAAQGKLIQAAKLSSLGKMVGGIAHEMNNPLTFITGNLAPLSRYINDLQQALTLYQSLDFKIPTPIQAQLEAIDLDFIFQDIPHILGSMKSGATRLATIIQGLRNFANLDQAAEKTIDIHQALDYSLLMVNNRLHTSTSRGTISLEKNYRFSPNTIECFPQLLNQALFQLITNAIDAIDEKAETNETITTPTIRITTQQQADSLVISIRDNGIGIAPEHYPHIFDPFFTTKPIGQGIGLGLSNVHQTIKRHNGNIRCQSRFNQGTTFEITLPLEQPKQP